MSKRDEDLVKVVRVTHPVRKLDLSWSSEEEKTKEESAKDLEEKLEAGTQETQEGQDQTGNFLVDNGDPTPTMPKDPPSILKVSKPSKPQRQNMQTSGIFNYFL